jgi:hypothetical protein
MIKECYEIIMKTVMIRGKREKAQLVLLGSLLAHLDFRTKD